MKLFNKLCLLGLILLKTSALLAANEVSLNGKWQIIFDQQNQGSGKKWQYRENFEKYYNIKSINVPSCWETLEQDYEGVAWYGKSFRMPEGWRNKTIRITFGAVNYRAEVWLNGEPVGYHDGGYTPFEFEIGDLINPDKENFLVLRVVGPIVNKDIVVDGFGRDDTPHWRGAITGGIWQEVKLLATDETYVKDVFIEPNIHTNTAQIHITLRNTGTAYQAMDALINIYPKKSLQQITSSKIQKLNLAPGDYKFTISLPLKDAKYWSPDNPYLYVLDLGLKQKGKVADEIKIPFGMRELTVKNEDFYLNGKKIYIKTGFWEGLYPNTLAFPENEEIIRKEFAYAKEIGFNCLRPWRKQVPPITLQLADELGMLIIGSPAIECMGQWPTATPFMEARMNTEFTELIGRDKNHPSIIMWELYNEIHRNALGRLKHKTAVMVRAMDPTRIIVDESGGWFGGAHAYMPYSIKPDTINEIHSYQPAPVQPNTYKVFENLGKTDAEFKALGLVPGKGRSKIEPGKLLFISEVGYGGLPDLDANMAQYRKTGNPVTSDYRYTSRLQVSIGNALKEMRVTDIFPSVSALCLASQQIQAQANKIQLEAVRINPNIDGYCVHAFTDGDWVLGAGILDIFRNKKKTFYTIKEINQPVYIAIKAEEQSLYTDENLQLKITGVSDTAPQKGNLVIAILDNANQAVFEHTEPISITSGISKYYSNNNIKLKEGNYMVRARFTLAKGEVISKNEYPVWVYPRQNQALKASVAVINTTQNISAFVKNNEYGIASITSMPAKNQVLIVANGDTSSQQSRAQLLQALNYVKLGGTAIYLNPANTNAKGNNTTQEKSPYFPFDIATRQATGHWISVAHIVKPHPIFDGLPSGQLMAQEYQNVCAVKSIISLNDKAIPVVSSLSWNIGIPEMWNYMGPTEAWWGNDMAIVPYGKGKIVVSMLRLNENLGKDPVADKIMYNLIKWAANGAR